MLRAALAAVRLVPRLALWNGAPMALNATRPATLAGRAFSSLLPAPGRLLADAKVAPISAGIISRGLVKFSMRKGKRKSVRAVKRRFFRLQWGGWIRTKCGRSKKLWKKSLAQKRRLRQHVLCNATQSTLLDKMAGEYWRRPKYWVDDVYRPYHERPEHLLASRKPRPYFPPEK